MRSGISRGVCPGCPICPSCPICPECPVPANIRIDRPALADSVAEKEHVPVERLVSLALAQALGAWQSESIIAERAKRGNREKFLAVLGKAPDVEPPEYDRMTEKE